MDQGLMSSDGPAVDGGFRSQLLQLAARARRLYAQALDAGVAHVVRPSVPILYFGDAVAYERSKLRVVTVGLNPSLLEFPPATPFSRFPLAERAGDDHERYLRSLDEYFRVKPYTAWFNPSFEELLRGLGTSYYGRDGSAALHTDLCSPIPTDPTWSSLSVPERNALVPEGKQLWHDLVDVLEPDVVLISIARHRLALIDFPLVDRDRVFHTVDGPQRKRPYKLECSRRELRGGKTPLFVYGNASQTPFGSISGADKRRIGQLVLELLQDG